MAIDRVFLNWDEPALPCAARWLLERYGRPGRWDLSGVVLVTPGRRSGRRLLELLVEMASPRVFIPPAQMITPGSLFDLLAEPPSPWADPLRSALARVRSLRDADPAALRRILPVPPAEDDLRAWLTLAADFQALHETLSADGATFDQVLAKCRDKFDFDDQERWEVLSGLQREYEAVLRRQGLCDRHAMHIDASRHLRGDVTSDVVLIATADLPGVVRRLLAAYSGRMFALIHAPESEADAFDEAGCIIPDKWVGRSVGLDPVHVHIVDRPRDQAHEVVDVIVNLASSESVAKGSPITPDQVTIGLGDPTLAPLIERTLELAGVPARSAAGRPFLQTRPGLFLDAWGQYLRHQRFDALAALLRHPDTEVFLLETLGPQTRGAMDGWLTLLDRYLSQHVQNRVGQRWLGGPEIAGPLESVRGAIAGLGGENSGELRPLPQWSGVISAAFLRVYGRRPLDRHNPQEAGLIATLRIIGQALADQAGLDPADMVTPRVSLADAVTLTLSCLRDVTLPPVAGESEGPAVELLGWLELQLDDAPALILTGVNEGYIPESVNHDAFLPDHVRRELGLLDNRRRHARDLMTLTAILHSRPIVCLISGRRSAQDDPLMPSRLLLACPPTELAARVCEFYDRPAEEPAAAPLLRWGNESRFLLPAPVPPQEPITELEVTAFRDYLACPYRFYLKHVRRLTTLDDRAVEMTPPVFGSLAHSVLDDFGRGHLAASQDAAQIADYLAQTLESLCRRNFGADPPAAITLQREQLRQRLDAFAAWQARQVGEGWRILGVTEKRLSASFEVDGQPFKLTGRIDRIDQHPELGVRILDYKTGDNGNDPQKAHRSGDAWIDLQLPLYRLLARSAGLSGEIDLGYVLLPKKLKGIKFVSAEWDDDMLASAEEEARQIVRAIRQNIFWPPTDPAAFGDGFAALCLDSYPDRSGVIAQVGQAILAGRRGGGG